MKTFLKVAVLCVKVIEFYKRFLNSNPNVPAAALNQVRNHVMEFER